MDTNSNSDNDAPNQSKFLSDQENVTSATDIPLRRSLRLSQKFENAHAKKAMSLKEEPMDIVPSSMARSKSIQTVAMESEDLLNDYEFADTQIFPHQMLIENDHKTDIYLSPPLDLSRAAQLNLNQNTLPDIISKMGTRGGAASAKSSSGSSLMADTRNVITQTKIPRTISKQRGRPRNYKVTSSKKSTYSERKIIGKKTLHNKGHSMKTRLSTSRAGRKNYCQSLKRGMKRCSSKNRCNYQERLKNFRVTARRKQLPSPLYARWRPVFQPSILPERYPAHFVYQLPPAVARSPNEANRFKKHHDGSPDNCSSTSTSPSLPNSLRGVFHTDDIHELLNIDRVCYRLYDSHVKALAIVLNIENNYLRNVLDKIVNISSNVLSKVDTVLKSQFVENDGGDLFPENTSPSPDVITSSPKVNSQRHFPSQRKI